MIKRTRFVIAVPDLEVSSAFYRDVLGFTIQKVSDPGWLFYVSGECTIMAGECRNAIPPGQLGDHSYFAYLDVDNIEDFYQSVCAKGTEVAKTLRNEPWGMREFGIRTADGHRIMFGSPINK